MLDPLSFFNSHISRIIYYSIQLTQSKDVAGDGSRITLAFQYFCLTCKMAITLLGLLNFEHLLHE